MAVLRSDNMVFYHPCDSVTDGAGLDWTVDSPVTFSAGGKVGNYADRTGTPAGQLVHASYPAVGAVDRFTVAAWANFGADFFIGHMPTWHALQLFVNGDVRVFYGPGNFTISGAVSTVSGSWTLYVLDLERSGSNWILRHSVNGAPFTEESPVSQPAFSGTGGNGLVGMRAPVDEAVLWRNLDEPFTSDELANLHDLADTFGLGMDQYSEQYEAPICWQATASMPDGTVWRDSGSGPCPAVIRVPRGALDIVVTDEGRVVSPRIQEG